MWNKRWNVLIALLCLSLLRAGAQVSFLTEAIKPGIVSKDDSTYIVKQIDNSQKLEYSDPDSAIAIVNRMIALSVEKNFVYGLSKSYIALAVYAMTQGNYRQSDSLSRAGYLYCQMSTRINRTNRLLSFWYLQRGHLASYQGHYDRAVDCGYKALHLLDIQPTDSGVNSLRANIHNFIGGMLQYLGEPEKALHYLDKGMALAMLNKDSNSLAQLYVNFGNAYSGMKQWQKAEATLLKALSISEAEKNIFVTQVAYLGLAEICRKRGNSTQAIVYLNKAIATSDKTNPYMAKVTPRLILGHIYLEQGKPGLSRRYGHEALQTAEQIGSAQYIAAAHGLLADASETAGNWQQAYDHRQSEHRISDSIRSEKKMLDINQLEIRSRVAEKDKQMVEQSLFLNRQQAALREKNLWLTGIASATLLLAALLISIRRRYQQRQKAQIKEIEIVRLKGLMEGEEQERSRIARDLHDGVVSQLLAVKLNLTTALSRYQDMAKQADFDRSLRYLEEAMVDLRNTAHNLMPVPESNNDLPGMISAFCEKIGYGTETEIIYKIYGSGNPANISYALPLFRIVQELVQNALKHAAAGYILVQLNCEPDLLAVSVEDDGCGFDVNSQGTGISGLRDRVSRLRGKISIESGRQGTSIYLEFMNIDNGLAGH